MVNEPQDIDEDTSHPLQFTSDMTDSENLHVQNECETDVCVTEWLINDCIQEESAVQNDWSQTNHKGTDEKVVQVDSYFKYWVKQRYVNCISRNMFGFDQITAEFRRATYLVFPNLLYPEFLGNG